MAAAAAVAAILLLPSLLTVVSPSSPSAAAAAVVTLIPPTPLTNHTLALDRSRTRAAALSSFSGGVSVRWAYGDYVMPIALGSPPVTVLATADTSSDLTWVKCIPCVNCFGDPNPPFDPSSSSSFASVGCDDAACLALDRHSRTSCTASGCGYTYSFAAEQHDAHHFSTGFLAVDQLALAGGKIVVPRFAFGCSHSILGLDQYAGVVGLGKGNLSLIRQLGVTVFSYCLISATPAKRLPIHFGAVATADASAAATTVHTTPLIADAPYAAYYYVRLVGVSVAGRRVKIPARAFSLNYTDGTGGVIFDSGTTLTLLAPAPYTHVVQAVKASITGAGVPLQNGYGYEVCVRMTGDGVSIPVLTLHFAGSADMALGFGESFQEVADGVSCLMMAESPSTLSVIGNVMQMNKRMVFDLDRMVIQWHDADCAAAGGGDGDEAAADA